jgi:DNA polymerase/3'-5' exonuclease PolX/endonuclease IV
MIGFHTDIDNIENYIDKYSLQVFLGSPFGFKSTTVYDNFELNKNAKNKVYIHSKYVGNIGKPNNRAGTNIKKELYFLENNLNMKNSGTIIHLSKKYGKTNDESLNIIINNLNKILDNLPNIRNYIIIETSNNIAHSGAKIEDLEYIYKNIKNKNKSKIKFCIDTAHVFNTFYDIDTVQGMISFFEKIDRYIGLKNIACIHLNDSLGSPFLSKTEHIEIKKGNIFNNSDNKNLIFLKTIAQMFNIDVIIERGVVKNNDDFIKIKKEIDIYNLLTTNKYKNNDILNLFINKKIIYYLNEYRDIYEKTHNNKYYTYIKATSNLINNQVTHLWENNNIINTDDDILDLYKNIPNIGDSIAKKILNIIKNDYSDLDELKKETQYDIYKFYDKFNFLGSDTIKTLIKKKYYTLDDLLKDTNNILSKDDKYYIILINKLEPLSKSYVEKIKQTISNKFEWYILGSYIRNDNLINDIDILVIDTDILTFFNNNFKNNKKYKIKKILRSGEFMLSAILEYEKKYFQLDIIYSSVEDKYTNILYFTGSKNFNIFMRHKAKQMGYKLNQNGLYKNDKKIKINNEKEIFDLLKLKYVEPYKRI